MSLSDNTVNYLLPLSLDGLTSIEVDSFKLNTGAGVLESDANGDVIATYDVDLNSITPTSSELLIDGGIRTSGNIGLEVPLGKTIYYDLQLGPIDTSLAINKYISIPALTGYDSGIKLTENSAAGSNNEYGFQLRYKGAGLDNRFEILSGSNPSIPGGDFVNRSLTIARDSANACIGSVINTSYPLSTTSSNAYSRQLNINGATNASLAVNNASGNLDVCVAGSAGAFSSDAVLGDAVIRQSTASRKLLLQCGTGGAGICIDNANNVGIAKSTGLGAYKLDVLAGIGTQDGDIATYTNSATNSKGFRIKTSGQTTQKTGIYGSGTTDNGYIIYANDTLSIAGNSQGNLGFGTGASTTIGRRVQCDGSINLVSGNYLIGGVQLNSGMIPENTNLYYTSGRATTDARLAISTTSTSPLSLTYDNTTGLISGSITGSAISKWLDAVSGGIYRNSRIAVNFTDTRSDSVIYSRTDPTNSITAGLYIESPTTGGCQIIQKTTSAQYAQSVSSIGYKIINQTVGSNNNSLNVNLDGTFEVYNGNTSNGTSLRLTDGTNFGATGTGANIFYGPSTDRTFYLINQESTNSNGIQFWTNDTALDERWRINKNGSLTNKKTTTTKILDINGDVRLGATTSPNFKISFGQPSGTTIGDGCYIEGTSNNVNFINQQAGTLNIGTNNTTNMTLSTSGNLGIGTTTPGSYKLNVVGDTNLNSCLIFAPILQLSNLSGGALTRDTATFTKTSNNTRIVVHIDGSNYAFTNRLVNYIAYLYTSAGVYTGQLVQSWLFFNASQHQFFSFSRAFTGINAGSYFIRFVFAGGFAVVDGNDTLYIHWYEGLN